MGTEETKERLLDAAERLFARHGYHNTSLRAITAAANANLAAVNYHFGNKEALMAAVLERRLIPLNNARLKRLNAVEQRAARQHTLPTASEVLRAFIEPTLRFKESSNGAQDFITLIGRAITEPDDPIKAKFIELIGPVIFKLFALLRAALPHIPKAALHIRLFFALGGLSHAMMMNGRWPTLSPDIPSQTDAQSLIDQLIPFLAAGLEADA